MTEEVQEQTPPQETQQLTVTESAKTGVVVEYESFTKMAQLMAKARASLPEHLHNNPGDCLAIVMMATRWGMNPYMVGQKTSVINKRLMYEGQLVAAIVNASGALSGRFRYTYTGQGNDRICTCTGTIRGESEERTVEVGMPSAGQAANSPLWKGTQSDKDQQLSYKAARVWVRRHAPEVLLGVYTPEDDWTNDDKPVVAEVIANQQDAFTMKALENKIPAEPIIFTAKQEEKETVKQTLKGNE